MVTITTSYCDFCGRELSYVSDHCKILGSHQRTELENKGFNYDGCIWCFEEIKKIIESKIKRKK